MQSYRGRTSHGALAVVTTAEMAAVDRAAAAAGTPGIVLMDRAGRAVADRAERMLERHGGGGVLVLCGPGNNGGDGFVAASLLAARGHAVTVASLGPVADLRGDAAAAAAAWPGALAEAATVEPERHALVVDALFGAGLSRPLAGAARALVERIAGARCRVLAVDLPSGLSGDSGAVMGAALRADETVTFFRLKPGHLLMPGRELCGTVTLADIGLGDAALDDIGPTLFHDRPDLWWRRLSEAGGGRTQIFARPPARGVGSHADARGLAARGARRASGRRRARDAGEPAGRPRRPCGPAHLDHAEALRGAAGPRRHPGRRPQERRRSGAGPRPPRRHAGARRGRPGARREDPGGRARRRRPDALRGPARRPRRPGAPAPRGPWW